MNINGYSGYSNSLFNPYSSAPNSQTVGGVQNDALALNREATQIELKSPPSSTNNANNDFRVSISQEAQDTIQQSSQTSMQATGSSATEPLPVNGNSTTISTPEMDQSQQEGQVIEAFRTERTDQNQQLQKAQQDQQVQSQFYQSPYGQMPLSRTSIDLMV